MKRELRSVGVAKGIGSYMDWWRGNEGRCGCCSCLLVENALQNKRGFARQITHFSGEIHPMGERIDGSLEGYCLSLLRYLVIIVCVGRYNGI